MPSLPKTRRNGHEHTLRSRRSVASVARAFAHPVDVARDPDLTLNEKRAILASWASDACALEAAPELREVPGGHARALRGRHGCVARSRPAGRVTRCRALKRRQRKRRLRGLLRPPWARSGPFGAIGAAMFATMIDRYVIGRERNVVRVDFSRKPEPPGPTFPRCRRDAVLCRAVSVRQCGRGRSADRGRVMKTVLIVLLIAAHRSGRVRWGGSRRAG